MRHTHNGIFGGNENSVYSPLVAAESQYPSRFHGSTFFKVQSIPEFRTNPMYVPGLGAAPSPGCGRSGLRSVGNLGASPDGIGQYDISRNDSFGAIPSPGTVAVGVGLGCAVIGLLGGAAVGAVAGAIVGKKTVVGALIGGVAGAVIYGGACGVVGYKAGEKLQETAATMTPEQLQAAIVAR